jgi:hypothetical protein
MAGVTRLDPTALAGQPEVQEGRALTGTAKVYVIRESGEE